MLMMLCCLCWLWQEIKLALHLLRFPEVINRVLKVRGRALFHSIHPLTLSLHSRLDIFFDWQDLSPKHLCDYVYELSTVFTRFYDQCYCVRKDKTGKVVEVNVNRLLLVKATGMVIKQVLLLLGIRTLDRM